MADQLKAVSENREDKCSIPAENKFMHTRHKTGYISYSTGDRHLQVVSVQCTIAHAAIHFY